MSECHSVKLCEGYKTPHLPAVQITRLWALRDLERGACLRSWMIWKLAHGLLWWLQGTRAPIVCLHQMSNEHFRIYSQKLVVLYITDYNYDYWCNHSVIWILDIRIINKTIQFDLVSEVSERGMCISVLVSSSPVC